MEVSRELPYLESLYSQECPDVGVGRALRNINGFFRARWGNTGPERSRQLAQSPLGKRGVGNLPEGLYVFPRHVVICQLALPRDRTRQGTCPVDVRAWVV